MADQTTAFVQRHGCDLIIPYYRLAAMAGETITTDELDRIAAALSRSSSVFVEIVDAVVAEVMIDEDS